MGFTPYKARRMKSAMPQKSKSEPEDNKIRFDEDKWDTYQDVDKAKFKAYKTASEKAQSTVQQDSTLTKSGVLAGMKNADDNAYQAYQEGMAHTMDSLNRVTNNDVASIHALWEADKITRAKYNEMMKGQKIISPAE